MPPPFTQSVILPPIFNDMMAMVRENRFMHLAALEQQRELMRYMNSLNEWLGHDVEDRQAELRGVAARIDQLRDDVIPPQGPGVEPSGFIVAGGPGVLGAPGAPGSSAASRTSVRPTSFFSRARQLFSSGTVPPADPSVPQFPQVSSQPTHDEQQPVGVIPPAETRGHEMSTPIDSPVVPSPPSPWGGGASFISPDLGSVWGSVAIPPQQVHQPTVSANDDEIHHLWNPASKPTGRTPSPPRPRNDNCPPQPDVISSAIPSTSTTKPVYDERPDESGLVPPVADQLLFQVGASPRPGDLELPEFDDRQEDPQESK
ncbi:hypothetical protein BGY98DRAFT_1001049 [Russula aff. rugulosa BPL654]|nr:hypothetical protein BGY98DRAFT_1001049 [Russula aff. rugulosa BPL654]